MTKRKTEYLGNRFLIRWLQPHRVILLTSTISGLAWAFPDFGILRKGLLSFYFPETAGIFTALAFMLVISFCAYSGFRVGKRLFKPWRQADRKVPIDSFTPYLIFSVIAWIGVINVFSSLIVSLGVPGVIHALSTNSANTLKYTLYEEYSAGLPSLRYISILSGALGIYHILNKRFIFLSLLNIVTLLMVSLISSRLSLICTVVSALVLIAGNYRFRIRRRAVVSSIILLFFLLSTLNWSRNGAFYHSIGLNNFFVAGFSEILTYLGSAFQGFIAAADQRDSLAYRSGDVFGLAYALQISPELTTNSALLQLITEGGTLWAFAFGGLVCFIASLACAFAIKNRHNTFFLVYAPLIYSFAELWRLYLFGQGIVKTLLIISLAVPLYLTLAPKISFPRFRSQRSLVRRYSRRA